MSVRREDGLHYRLYSRYVKAAILGDENKRFLISSFCSFTSSCTLQHWYLCPKRLVANYPNILAGQTRRFDCLIRVSLIWNMSPDVSRVCIFDIYGGNLSLNSWQFRVCSRPNKYASFMVRMEVNEHCRLKGVMKFQTTVRANTFLTAKIYLR